MCSALLTAVVLAAAETAWVELPFHARAAKIERTPPELTGHPPRASWSIWELELDAKPGAKLRLAELSPALSATELALLPAGDAQTAYALLSEQLGTSISPGAVAMPAASTAARLALPRVGELALSSTADPGATTWRAFGLAVTLDRATLKGSLFLRAGGWPAAAQSAGARLDDWKLLSSRPVTPLMMWQRSSLTVDGRELAVTNLETGKVARVTLDAEVSDVGCATLKPLLCAAALGSGLVLLEGAAKRPLDGLANAGLELSPDGAWVAAVQTSGEQVTVGIYQRSKKKWVRHVIASRSVVDLGRFSDDPPGFVITVEGEGSLLLSLDTTERKSIPRSGPSWTSPLGRKLERRGDVTWLHEPHAPPVALDWVKLDAAPNAWLGERFVLHGGGAEVTVLDLEEKRALPLLDARLKVGNVFPVGDDPTWVLVARPEGTYRARLSLEP